MFDENEREAPTDHTPTHSHSHTANQYVSFFLFFLSSSSSFSQVFFPFFFLHFILCFKGLNMQNSKNYTQIIQPKLSTHILGHFNVVILLFTSFFFFPFFIFIFYFFYCGLAVFLLIWWTSDLKVGAIFFIWLSFVVISNNGVGSFDMRERAKTMEVKRERWGKVIRERTEEKAGNEREKMHCYVQLDARLWVPQCSIYLW